MLYFDNAASSLKKPPGVIAAVSQALTSFGGAGRSFHSPALTAGRALYSCREELSTLTGASPHRICFASGATQAINTALRSIASQACREGAALYLVSTQASHNAMLRPAYALEREAAYKGALPCQLTIVPHEKDGALHLDTLEAYLLEGLNYEEQSSLPVVKALLFNHASNVTGELYPLEAVVAQAKRYGYALIVDAAQSLGHLPIDLSENGPLGSIDYLCFTGHKALCGPQGTGGLIVGAERAQNPKACTVPLIYGGSGYDSQEHDQPRELPDRLEAGTQNAHSIAGLGAAVADINAGDLSWEHVRIQELRLRIWDALTGLSPLKLKGRREGENTGIIAFKHASYSCSQYAQILYEKAEICSRSGFHCAPLMMEALGTQQSGLIRLSLGRYNTIDEVESLIKAIQESC